ncbi:MAG: hypothetical protein ACXVCY_17660 [Pseudobdellovibrionaceae bacterium]
MFQKWTRVSLAVAFSVTTATSFAKIHNKREARPPQYIMLGFEGGLDLNQWQSTRNFAAELNKTNKPLNFTYFISGVYFLRGTNRHFYSPPKHDIGYSAIGFAKTSGDIYNRIGMMNDSFAEGHEIASNGNGHFNGQAEKWTTEDWTSELKQFNDFVFESYFNNGLTPNAKYPQGYALAQKDIVGFRAPYLGVNDGLWGALKDLSFKYDTSMTGEMTIWPQKSPLGLWKISVPIIEMAGTGKRIIGMDYNFYMVQSKGKEDIPNREVYRKQMFDSYMNYFNFNYYGRRAPINISHHFTLYNGGAYWDAMQDFAKAVCGMPEVHCVTYKTYVAWLDTLTPEVLQSYRTGQFDPLPRPHNIDYHPERALDVTVRLEKDGTNLVTKSEGKDLTSDMKTILKVNGQIWEGNSIPLSDLRQRFATGTDVEISASLINSHGREVQSDTHQLIGLGTDHEVFNSLSEENKLLAPDQQ